MLDTWFNFPANQVMDIWVEPRICPIAERVMDQLSTISETWLSELKPPDPELPLLPTPPR